jgi:hypothetical protein
MTPHGAMRPPPGADRKDHLPLQTCTARETPGQWPGVGAGMKGFEPSVSALTGQRVRPLHHTPERAEVYHSQMAPAR